MKNEHDTSNLIEKFQRDQSRIAAAYVEYLAEKEGVWYSEMEAVKTLSFYLRIDQARYEQILEELRPRMQEIQRGDRVMSISREA